MKRNDLIHPELSHVIAQMGHGQKLAVVDAGMPIPQGIRRIDLAFAPAQPGWLPVIEVIQKELCIESYIFASELAEQHVQELARCLNSEILDNQNPTAQDAGTQASGQRDELVAEVISHTELKEQLADCVAVVRTGEFTAYANVILVAGVVF